MVDLKIFGGLVGWNYLKTLCPTGQLSVRILT